PWISRSTGAPTDKQNRNLGHPTAQSEAPRLRPTGEWTSRSPSPTRARSFASTHSSPSRTARTRACPTTRGTTANTPIWQRAMSLATARPIWSCRASCCSEAAADERRSRRPISCRATEFDGLGHVAPDGFSHGVERQIVGVAPEWIFDLHANLLDSEEPIGNDRRGERGHRSHGV